MSQRHNLTQEAFTTISWQSLHYALEQFSTHRRALAIKALHRHLPTHDKLFKQGRVVMSSLCPCCMRNEETNSHVICCPNDEAVKQRKEAWLDLLGIPGGTTMVERLPLARDELADLLQLAVEEQTKIGWDNWLD